MNTIKSKITNTNGFTMVELMITLAISSVVMIGVFSTFQNQKKSYGIQEEVVVMQQNLRAAMNLMARELRMASYSPVNHTGQIITAQTNLLEFSNEIDNSGTMQTIQYDLYDAYADGDTDIGREVDGANKRALAENIDALEFVYLDTDGNTITAPVAGTGLADITTIQVSMLARAAQSEPDFLSTFDYFPASCPQAPPPAVLNDACLAGSAWDFDGIGNNTNRFNDNFRRRLLTATIELRNPPL